jgi:hypothetical protein
MYPDFLYRVWGWAFPGGLCAQRKLDGDPDIYGPDDPEELRHLVEAGKAFEEALRDSPYGQQFIDQAYKRAGVKQPPKKVNPMSLKYPLEN